MTRSKKSNPSSGSNEPSLREKIDKIFYMGRCADCKVFDFCGEVIVPILEEMDDAIKRHDRKFKEIEPAIKKIRRL